MLVVDLHVCQHACFHYMLHLVVFFVSSVFFESGLSCSAHVLVSFSFFSQSPVLVIFQGVMYVFSGFFLIFKLCSRACFFSARVFTCFTLRFCVFDHFVHVSPAYMFSRLHFFKRACFHHMFGVFVCIQRVWFSVCRSRVRFSIFFFVFFFDLFFSACFCRVLF